MAKVIKKKSRIESTILITIAIIVLILGYFVISLFIANTLTAAKTNQTDNSPVFVGPHAKDIVFKAADGLTLHGWLYKNTNANSNSRIVIQVAGFSQNRSNDDYYGLFISHDLYQNGYSILLFDPRESEPGATRIDFGQHRGNDVLGAIQFAKANGFAPHNIGIIADSLGAVETLMVVEQLQDIGPIVLDSGIAQMKPFLELRMGKDDNIPSFLYPGIFLMAKIFYHQDIQAINPVNHVANVPDRTFLFLVGAKDEYVPPVNSEELFKAANSESKLVIFPTAGHVHTYRSDPALYLKTIYAFFNQQFVKQ